MELERLQKIIAHAGFASRREAETMIREGRVTVNGRVVTALGSRADAGSDHIKVDGKLITHAEPHRYILLYKPKEVMTTVEDPQGRRTVIDLVRGVRERIYPVGRLDFHSEGL
ncbi:MAG TPA: S4 domain-containing protein, partial [Thermoanaerobaculia bacterium]|nr:S4 domain-containing protein [Thermoanaerobaculia bacterium]